MALITLQDAKTFLGIWDNESDAEINQIIPQAEALFYSLLKVDSLEVQIKTEIVPFRDKTARFKNFPINSIIQIVGEDYKGQEWADYLTSKNEVKFLQPDFLGKVKNNRLQIKYNFWFSTIPTDIKLAILILVAGLYNIKENYGTTSCKIGQESFSFRDITESEDFKRIVNNYKKKFIFVI